MMNQDQINQLKAEVKSGDVMWKNHNGGCTKVTSVLLEWVEFQDEPDLTEPAAILSDGTAVALLNAEVDEFVRITPVFQ